MNFYLLHHLERMLSENPPVLSLSYLFSEKIMIYWFLYILLTAERKEKSMQLIIFLFCETTKNYRGKMNWLPFLLLWWNGKGWCGILLQIPSRYRRAISFLRTGILESEKSRQINFGFINLEHWKVCQDIIQCRELQGGCPRFQKDCKLNFQPSFWRLCIFWWRTWLNTLKELCYTGDVVHTAFEKGLAWGEDLSWQF